MKCGKLPWRLRRCSQTQQSVVVLPTSRILTACDVGCRGWRDGWTMQQLSADLRARCGETIVRCSTAFSERILLRKALGLQEWHEQNLLHRISCCRRTPVLVLTYGKYSMSAVRSKASVLARRLSVLQIWLRKRMAHHRTFVWMK